MADPINSAFLAGVSVGAEPIQPDLPPQQRDEISKISEHNKNVRSETFQRLADRLESAAVVAEDLLSLSHEKAHSHAVAASSLGRVATASTQHSKEIGGNAAVTLDHLISLLAASASYHTNMAASLGGEFSHNLQEMEKTSRGATEEGRAQCAQLERDLDAAMQNASRANLRLWQLSEAAGSKDALLGDPYMAGLQLKEQIDFLREAEYNFNDGASSLARTVEEVDRHRLESIRGVLQAYLEAHEVCGTTLMDETADLVRELEKQQPVDDALNVRLASAVSKLSARSGHTVLAIGQDASLSLEAVFGALQSEAASLHYNPAQDIVKEGALKRKGKVFGGWKECRAVLSKYGFLHYYDATGNTPDGSLALTDCQVDIDQSHFTFTITSGPGAWRSRVTFQANDRQSMLDWATLAGSFVHQKS
eukprot:TRINITY_DN8005_c0_g1_i1.p1 TRINITY_DN8005_c0_g1~~TRINITY_DN8005_c0_g1_i1.p1  ORF type:complete len:421 (+),score=81.36 TRINITY_DN8005_c0_g1_i1:49-1311(+)